MEGKVYALGLSRGENIIQRLWSRDTINELLYEEPIDWLEDKEPVLKPLPLRILILALYYPFCVLFTVLYPIIITALLLVFLPIAGVVHLIQQRRQRR